MSRTRIAKKGYVGQSSAKTHTSHRQGPAACLADKV